MITYAFSDAMFRQALKLLGDMWKMPEWGVPGSTRAEAMAFHTANRTALMVSFTCLTCHQ